MGYKGGAMRKLASFILGALAFAGLPARGDTSYWVGASVAVTTYTNQNNWLGGVLPGAGDTAIYTNTYRSSASDLRITMTDPVTNAVVVLDYVPNGTRVFGFSNANWWVTDRFAVNPSAAGRTNAVRLLHGTLTVTNASRSASVVVGNGVGHGILDVVGGATLNVACFTSRTARATWRPPRATPSTGT
jgi:hypothetical protein